MKTTSPILNGFVAMLALSSFFCLPAQDSTAEGQQKQAPVATVNGTPIMDADLKIGGKLIQLEQEAYQARLDALEEVVNDRLLSQEAKKNNTTVEELLKQHVESKLSDPSPAEVEAFYERQKSRIGQPLAEVRPQIEEFLKGMKRAEGRSTYLAGLREGSDVKILLEAPRIPVEIGESPQRGPSDAPVTIVEFSDFQCPFCKRAQPTLAQLEKKYSGQVRFVYKDLPLREIHPQAQSAAEAAHCAEDQGKFWEYHEALFAAPEITEASLPEIASSLGLDALAFHQCLDSRKHQAQVDAGLAQAMEVGAGSTPTFFVNGILLRGAQPLESFSKVIDAELAAR
jgi:predicted DsbA family dithiol-disulfide isomerase